MTQSEHAATGAGLSQCDRIRRLEAAGNAMHHEMQFGEWRAGTPRPQGWSRE